MGLFKKKEEKKFKGKLPELPELPELPKLKEFDSALPQLPRYPTSQLGDELSRTTIKEAVTGKKEEEVEADEFVREQMMPQPHEIKPSTKFKPELPFKIEKIAPLKELKIKTRAKGPVFIRIDKFEESLKIFEETKAKIHGMEKLLAEIKQLKEKEEIELSNWRTEIQTMKNQIEKVERDIISKIE